MYKIWLFLVVLVVLGVANSKDMMRKSIVYDKNTPDVFYCPIHKPTGFDKLIVKARPLKKLCEFEGGALPEDYKSDCYQDVDESDYACKEKYRIMMRQSPPGNDENGASFDGKRLARFINVDKEYYVAKMPITEPKSRQSVKRVVKRKKSLLRNRLFGHN